MKAGSALMAQIGGGDFHCHGFPSLTTAPVKRTK